LPFWAQLTDIFGRHLIVQVAVVLIIVGSAICTGAPTSVFGVLLLGRSLQGIGAAGINISIRKILADRVSLSDYALNWTIFTLVFGISFSIGPVIGGFLTETSWRWCQDKASAPSKVDRHTDSVMTSDISLAVPILRYLLSPGPLISIMQAHGNLCSGKWIERK
jgi:MFS family permease